MPKNGVPQEELNWRRVTFFVVESVAAPSHRWPLVLTKWSSESTTGHKWHETSKRSPKFGGEVPTCPFLHRLSCSPSGPDTAEF